MTQTPTIAQYAIEIKVGGKWLRADRARKSPWLYGKDDAEAEIARLTAEYEGREYRLAYVGLI